MVSVPAGAPAQVSPMATVSGGGAFGASAMDAIHIGHPEARSAASPAPRTLLPLLITSGILDGAVQYQPYTQALHAEGGTPPYTWSVLRTQDNVSLPEGMMLDPSTGVVSAAAVNGQGGYEVAIQVTDSASPPNSATAVLNFGVDSDTSFAGCQMFPTRFDLQPEHQRAPGRPDPNHQIPSANLSLPIHPDFGQGFYPARAASLGCAFPRIRPSRM